MAKWDKITSRGSVEDRRGVSAGFGGVGLVGVLLVVGFNLISNGGSIDVGQVVSQLESVQAGSSQSVTAEEFAGVDDYELFASTVLGSNNDVWRQVFEASSKTYDEPNLTLFRTSVSTGCGFASSAVGPFYCPPDQTIYLDETFFEELTSQFGATGGDVAEAYVIAHEVGHHVQNLLGLLSGRTSNEESIRTELQADCFAGVWAYSLRDKGIFEINEFNEAIDAAESVGDDHIQESVSGDVNPETWTHGSSEQRKYWLNVGFETGDPSRCSVQ